MREDNRQTGEEMGAERQRFDRLKGDAARPQVFSSFNLFPTPPMLAEQVIEIANIHSGLSVLEPSAGMGALAIAAREAGGAVECVEIDLPMANYLIDQGFAVECCDFLALPVGQVDRVVMNPPFKMGTDIKHIRHALEWLKPGGRLVSICANGPKQREQLQPIATRWIELPPGSFKSEGTNVATAIVIFDR
ncbi:methyltransferase [Anatilimnocola floriformis]|uniref:methyltransferase n=1 Tax=Anatilimnocola floriformis TaxID=2948575 RepID=UPI0020C2B2EB|nr:class I SAM-dependent methyltransferase [Anatilimnocola floriformis]